MRTALLRLLPVAVLALPLVALSAAAQDKPSPSRAAGASAAPPAVQQIPYTPPEGPPVYDPAMWPPAPPADPTLEEMVKELKQLRAKEKKLAEAIREKVKAQRKALDDAEREVGGAGQCGPYPPSSLFMW